MPKAPDLMALQNTIFDYVTIITYLLYFVVALGLSTNAPEHLATLQYWIKVYVSAFLIFRFNPFRKVEFNDFDRRVAFSAGFFLFTTTIFETIMQFFPWMNKSANKDTNQNSSDNNTDFVDKYK